MPFHDASTAKTYRLVVSEVGPCASPDVVRQALLTRVGPLEERLAQWLDRGPAFGAGGPSEITMRLRFDADGWVTAVDVSGAPWRPVVALGLFGLRLPSDLAGLEVTVRLQVVETAALHGPT